MDLLWGALIAGAGVGLLAMSLFLAARVILNRTLRDLSAYRVPCDSCGVSTPVDDLEGLRIEDRTRWLCPKCRKKK